MQQSTNYNFNLPEGTDLVNLLTQLIPNWASLDSILRGVQNDTFETATETVALGVHALTRLDSNAKLLKWVATANYTAGETFTVDGTPIAAATPSGNTLATGAYVTGATVIAAINSDETAMTVFVTGTNVASDSERLGGELPSYYATDSDLDDVKTDVTDLDNLMGNTSITAIGDGTVTGAISSLDLDIQSLREEIPSMANPSLNFTTPLHTFSSGNLTFTATKDCYLFGIKPALSGGNININGLVIPATTQNPEQYISPLKLTTGDVVTCSVAMPNLHVLDVAS